MANVEELIKKYDIRREWNPEQGYTGKLRFRPPEGQEKKALEEVAAAKPEILAYLEEQRRIAIANLPENKIEGLRLIRENDRAQAAWRAEFNRLMDLGECVFPAAPEDKHDELLKQYPRAAAYIRAEAFALMHNYELADIGERACKRILQGEDYVQVIADMEAEDKAFVERHLWD